MRYSGQIKKCNLCNNPVRFKNNAIFWTRCRRLEILQHSGQVITCAMFRSGWRSRGATSRGATSDESRNDESQSDESRFSFILCICGFTPLCILAEAREKSCSYAQVPFSLHPFLLRINFNFSPGGEVQVKMCVAQRNHITWRGEMYMRSANDTQNYWREKDEIQVG